MNGQMDMGKTCMPSDREIKIIFSIAAYVAIEMPKSNGPIYLVVFICKIIRMNDASCEIQYNICL